MTLRDPAPAAAGSFEYRLQRTPVGVVVLDAARRITAANALALRLLKAPAEQVAGVSLLDLHPPAARDKLRWLIDQAENSPEGTASMVVATPMGSLVATVSQVTGPPERSGFCMVFHALGELAMAEPKPGAAPHLLKLPVLKSGATVLIDIAEVICLTARGHYSEVQTAAGRHLCPLSLAALEQRVDGALFLRVHRSHLVNLRHVLAAERADGQWWLSLSGPPKLRVPVGRRKVEQVRRLLAV